MSESELIRLIREDMDRAEQTMHAILTTALYEHQFEPPPLFSAYYGQPSRWKLFTVRFKRVRWYFEDLRDALLGRVKDEDYDD